MSSFNTRWVLCVIRLAKLRESKEALVNTIEWVLDLKAFRKLVWQKYFDFNYANKTKFTDSSVSTFLNNTF